MVRDEDRVLHPKKRCRLPIPLMFWNPPKKEKKYKEERKKSLEQETYIAKRFEERGFFWVRDRTLLLSIFYILFLQDINGMAKEIDKLPIWQKKSYPVVLWNPSGLRLFFHATAIGGKSERAKKYLFPYLSAGLVSLRQKRRMSFISVHEKKWDSRI